MAVCTPCHICVRFPESRRKRILSATTLMSAPTKSWLSPSVRRPQRSWASWESKRQNMEIMLWVGITHMHSKEEKRNKDWCTVQFGWSRPIHCYTRPLLHILNIISLTLPLNYFRVHFRSFILDYHTNLSIQGWIATLLIHEKNIICDINVPFV